MKGWGNEKQMALKLPDSLLGPLLHFTFNSLAIKVKRNQGKRDEVSPITTVTTVQTSTPVWSLFVRQQEMAEEG